MGGCYGRRVPVDHVTMAVLSVTSRSWTERYERRRRRRERLMSRSEFELLRRDLGWRPRPRECRPQPRWPPGAATCREPFLRSATAVSNSCGAGCSPSRSPSPPSLRPKSRARTYGPRAAGGPSGRSGSAASKPVFLAERDRRPSHSHRRWPTSLPRRRRHRHHHHHHHRYHPSNLDCSVATQSSTPAALLTAPASGPAKSLLAPPADWPKAQQE